MVEKDPDNDEYKFVESDFEEHKPVDEPFGDSDIASSKYAAMPENTNIMRNALIVVGVVVLLFIIYGFYHARGKQKPVQPPEPMKPIKPIESQPIANTVPVPVPVPVPVQTVDTELKQKVGSLENTQQGLASQVSSLTQELTTVSGSVKNLNDEINKLNQTLSTLSTQIQKQSGDIQTLMARTRAITLRAPPGHQIVYYIKAVIPGRAWLIAPNGSTISVREGTNLQGYGIVKLIDSLQGRVLTSSGRLIRFNQEDS